MFPFALESTPKGRKLRSTLKWAEASAVCCGCGQDLAIVTFHRDGTRSCAKLYPGYHANGNGVFMRKRPPRRPDLYEHDQRHSEREYAGRSVDRDTIVVCHRCDTRQIVRGE